ncbi:MAG: iron ABC transporter permease [Bacteroidaceae bacterium]|nr:iron ABC transporter permease [Bacteroidaceae bacterium]
MLFLLLLLLAIANLFFGSVSIPATEVIDALTGAEVSESVRLIVCQCRLPELVVAILAGGALAVSGLVMQTVFSNPLADPSLLGVNSGASLGVAIAILFCGGALTIGDLALSGYLLVLLCAFLGAVAVIVVLTLCSALMRSRLHLLVTGVMFSFVLSSLISILNFFAGAEGIRSYVVWGMGTFTSVSLERLPLLAIAVFGGVIGVFLMVKPLNAFLLGASYARNLGIRVGLSRTLLLGFVGLLTAVVTAFCGPISFIGLAVPHAVRWMYRTSNHRRLLPACFLGGAIVALACNLLAHVATDSGVLPINTLTPLLGVPIVLLLLWKNASVNVQD